MIVVLKPSTFSIRRLTVYNVTKIERSVDYWYLTKNGSTGQYSRDNYSVLKVK